MSDFATNVINCMMYYNGSFYCLYRNVYLLMYRCTIILSTLCTVPLIKTLTCLTGDSDMTSAGNFFEHNLRLLHRLVVQVWLEIFFRHQTLSFRNWEGLNKHFSRRNRTTVLVIQFPFYFSEADAQFYKVKHFVCFCLMDIPIFSISAKRPLR